jgi:hypothetical protein
MKGITASVAGAEVEQSFNEYLNAWVAIHILNHKLGYGSSLQTIFNMSVGYNLEGKKNQTFSVSR